MTLAEGVLATTREQRRDRSRGALSASVRHRWTLRVGAMRHAIRAGMTQERSGGRRAARWPAVTRLAEFGIRDC